MKPAPTRLKRAGRQPLPQPQSHPGAPPGLASREHYLLAGILTITALVYLRCLGNGYVFDDHEMIIVNRYIGDWSFLWKAFVNDSWWFRDPAHLPQSHYYRPLQDVWLGLNYQLFGLNPIGPHALMVGLHLLAVVLAYRIAARLTADRVAGLLAALLFGLLPVHAEAVVWATAIPESLAGTLQLGAFYFYLRYRDGGLGSSLAMVAGAVRWRIAQPRKRDRVSRAGRGAWLSFRRSTEPAVAGSPRHRPRALWRQGRRGSGAGRSFYRGRLDVSGGAACGARIHHQARRQQPGHAGPDHPDRSDGRGAQSRRDHQPVEAGPSHRIIWVNTARSADFWMPAAGLASDRPGGLDGARRQPATKALRFSVAWVFIAMAPVLNLGILYPNALVADRYMYFSSFGWCLMAGASVRRGRSSRNPGLAPGGSAMVAGLRR